MGSIVVSGLGKAYKKYHSRWSRLLEWLIPKALPRHQLKWVLQDINFVVNPGEAVGVIGINGAGKSTLLKMITGTTQPTCGTISVVGRVAAMLELGMGFHPDFTGRQNAFMAGQLLGFSVSDLHELMPEIEKFAEIGSYIDQPVRVYSSGMQVRLAFSVATAVRPDILIVDEALSVGDDYFQHKSFDRIRSFKSQGSTLLIVSHDKQAIQSICDRAILLNDGKVAFEGLPEAVMDNYNAMIADKKGVNVRQKVLGDGRNQVISGSGEVTITEISIFDKDGLPIEILGVGEDIVLRVNLLVHEKVNSLVLGYMIKDRLGQPLFGTNTYHLGKELFNVEAGSSPEFSFHFKANIGEGSYSIAVAVHGGMDHISKNYEWRDLAITFRVVNKGYSSFVGSAWLPPSLEYKL